MAFGLSSRHPKHLLGVASLCPGTLKCGLLPQPYCWSGISTTTPGPSVGPKTPTQSKSPLRRESPGQVGDDFHTFMLVFSEDRMRCFPHQSTLWDGMSLDTWATRLREVQS